MFDRLGLVVTAISALGAIEAAVVALFIATADRAKRTKSTNEAPLKSIAAQPV